MAYLSNYYDAEIIREYYLMEKENFILNAGLSFFDFIISNPLLSIFTTIFNIIMDAKLAAKHQEVVEFLQEHNLPVASDFNRDYYCWSEYFAVHPAGEETLPNFGPYFGEFARLTMMIMDGKVLYYYVNIEPEFLENLNIKEYSEIISPGLSQINAIEDADTIIKLNTQQKKQIQLALYENSPISTIHTYTIGKIISVKLNDTQNIIWPLNVSIYYTQEDLQNMGIQESGLVGLAFWNETINNWQLLSETGINRTNIEINGKYYEGYVWGNVWHLSFFGLYALTPPASRLYLSIVYHSKTQKQRLI